MMFSDRASFLKALAGLAEGTFLGSDLVYDKASQRMTLTVTHQEGGGAGQRGGFFGGRKPTYLKTVVTVNHITRYKQSLTEGIQDVYVLDRAEVGRGGLELSLYFRPGDHAVMDVERIDGSVEDTGRVTHAPKKPVVKNPLSKS